MKRAARSFGLAVAAMLTIVGLAGGAAARFPVRTGAWTELRYGLRSDHPWPTAYGGPERANRSTRRLPVGAPQSVWRTALPAGTATTPAIDADGGIYVGHMRGVSALDAGGALRWTTQLGRVQGTPSLLPTGEIAVVAPRGEVVVLGTDGSVHRRVVLGHAVDASPLVLEDGSLVVPTVADELVGLDLTLGITFRTRLRERAIEDVALDARGSLVVVSATRLTRLGADGVVLSEVMLGGRALLRPIVSPEGSVVVAEVGRVEQLDGRGRARATEVPTGAPWLAVTADGSVRVLVDQSLVSVRDGAVVWRTVVPGLASGLVVDADGAALCATTQTLYAIDAEGQERWRVPHPGAGAEPVIAGDGTILLAGQGGTIEAWR